MLQPAKGEIEKEGERWASGSMYKSGSEIYLYIETEGSGSLIKMDPSDR